MDLNDVDCLHVSLCEKYENDAKENPISFTNQYQNETKDFEDNPISFEHKQIKENKNSSKFININTKKNSSKKNILESKILSSKDILNNTKETFNNSKQKAIITSKFKKIVDYNNKDFETRKNFDENNEYNTKKIPNLKEKLTMSDLDMYYKFGYFPYILLIHILIIIFTTYIVS